MALPRRIALPLLLIAVLVLAVASIMVGVARTNTTSLAGLALVPADAVLAGIALNGLD
jgi:hypothetical protein